MIRRSLILGVALAVSSCGGSSDPCAGLSGTCVALTVKAATSTELDSLQIVASGAASGTKTSAFGRTRALPVTLAVRLSDSTASGALTLSVAGSRGGTIVAAGATSVDIVAGKEVSAAVDLQGVVAGSDLGAADDLSAPPDLTGVIPCTSGSQCPSQLCNQTTHQCAHDMCDDGIKDGSETAVDCGGPTCATRCAVAQACTVNSDCFTSVCDQSFCQSVSLAWRTGPALPVFDATWMTPLPGRDFAVTFNAAGVFYVVSGIGQVSGDGNAYEMTRVQFLDFTNGDTTWTLGDLVTQAVSGGGGGLGNDGKIYVGLGGNHNSSTKGVYSHPVRPGVGAAWTTVMSPPLETVREDFAYFTDANGLIYFMGGDGATTNQYTDTYDAKNAAWGSGPMMTVLRDGLFGVYAGGRIYAVGGYVDSDTNQAPVGTTEVYDPTPQTWKTLAPLQTPRRNLAGALGADNRIYAIGGSANSAQTPVAIVEAYTPATNVWTKVTPLTHPRVGLGVLVAPDGTIWAIAGDDGSGGGLSPWVEIYGPLVTPATKTPTHGATLALTGSSFAPNATVTASIAGQTVGTANTDANGALAGLTITLPSTVGAVAIQVVDDMSNYPVTVNVTAQ